MFKVILCGGVGSRLWPLSTESNPKQFNNDLSKISLFEQTIMRFSNDSDNDIEFDKFIIVSKEKYLKHIENAFSNKSVSNIDVIVEPCSRNTAPAIALAALHIRQKYQDGLMLICPSDHFIKEDNLLVSEVDKAKKYADNGSIVTFGIDPKSPETGFGYIKKSQALDNGDFFRVDCFVEKPNHQLATQYISDGGYLWNSGIFLIKASVYLEELRKYQPEILKQCLLSMSNAISKQNNNYFYIEPSKEFEKAPNISVDYAVIENSSDIVVKPLNLTWSDMGSWQSFYNMSEKDSNGNVILGNAVEIDTYNSYILSKDRLVTVMGLEDIIVVNSDDATIVVHKKYEQRIPELIEKIKNKTK